MEKNPHILQKKPTYLPRSQVKNLKLARAAFNDANDQLVICCKPELKHIPYEGMWHIVTATHLRKSILSFFFSLSGKIQSLLEVNLCWSAAVNILSRGLMEGMMIYSLYFVILTMLSFHSNDSTFVSLRLLTRSDKDDRSFSRKAPVSEASSSAPFFKYVLRGGQVQFICPALRWPATSPVALCGWRLEMPSARL